MFHIERRYQYRVRDGVKWTDWFTVDRCETIDEANEKLKERRKRKEPDKKLLGEYRIEEKEAKEEKKS